MTQAMYWAGRITKQGMHDKSPLPDAAMHF